MKTTTHLEIKSMVTEILEKENVDKIFYVACGGSIAAFHPSKYLIDTEGKKLSAGYYNANEFVHSTPASLTKSSIVVVCSHQGNTPETVKAAELAKSLGAIVVAFSYNEEAILYNHADYKILYSWGDAPIYSQKKESLGLLFSMELLHQIDGWDKYNEAMEAFNIYDSVVDKAILKSQDKAKKFAQVNKDSKGIYVLASGSCWGPAYIETHCILLEMQWIHSNAIHSGEFFHGPFEITDEDSNFLLLINEGPTRPLDERAISFLDKYTKNTTVIDAKELSEGKFHENIAQFFAPLTTLHVLDVYNNELADIRNHPLSTRRYMWKVEY